MTVTEPVPGVVGFSNVVSMSVQFSPLNPQFPVEHVARVSESRRRTSHPLIVQTCLQVPG